MRSSFRTRLNSSKWIGSSSTIIPLKSKMTARSIDYAYPKLSFVSNKYPLKESMTSAHHQHHAHGPIEYRFCPRCGGGLERRAIKAIEPKRLVCQACSFIFYQDPKLVAGTIFTLDSRVV